MVTEEEAHEFLKMIRHSEYEMLDQQHRTPARISLLSLLINSKSHCELLLKVLIDAHVLQDITPTKFEGIINNITTSCHLSFSEEEVPAEGKRHNQPLHIVVKCGSYMIARVDNESSLNVMSKATLDKLHSPSTILKSSPVMVRAFDRSKWEKVKFIVDGQLISAMGETKLIISTPLPIEYVEGDDEALKTSFQALKIVGTTSVEVGGDFKPSKVAIMAEKILISNGFEPGKGLGRKLDSIAELVTIQENPRQSKLGYYGATRRGKPGCKIQGKQQIRPNLYRYFTSRGIITSEQVATVEDQLAEPVEWIYPMEREMDNWTAEVLPELINNAGLTFDDARKSSTQDEGEDLEEEALIEFERLLEQERPKLQSEAEEVEVINLGEGEETKEIRIGKLMPLDLKQGLVEILRESTNIFAWSYRDMPGLDTTIVEHKLPLIPNTVPVRQQLRRMKPEMALRIKEEMEKQWNAGFLVVMEYP
ncbi:hypothetical protein CR513_18111, partial [Mucuna pruriens]